MFDPLLLFFLFAAGIIGVLASIILLFVNTNNKVTRFLGLHLLTASIQIFYIAAWNEKAIFAFPHIFLVNQPLLIMCVPSFYLYLKGILYNQKNNSLKFLWHFLPAIIVFVYYIPLYISSAEKKIQLIKARYNLFEQIEPPDFNIEALYVLILIVSTIVYSILILYTYIKFRKKEAAQKQNLARFIKWLTILFGFGFFNLAILMFVLIFVDSDNAARMLTQFVVGAHIITIGLTLFFNPAVLYGINEQSSANSSLSRFSYGRKLKITVQQKNEYLQTLQSYLLTNPFLRYNYSQKIMSEETKISIHHLSYLMNEHYKLRYNEFINKLRIDYVISEMNNKKWANYSIDGIASEVGFRSKSTFVQAFKKITGKTPSNYFKDISSDEGSISKISE